jgi:hypothetical protein
MGTGGCSACASTISRTFPTVAIATDPTKPASNAGGVEFAPPQVALFAVARRVGAAVTKVQGGGVYWGNQRKEKRDAKTATGSKREKKRAGANSTVDDKAAAEGARSSGV